jgi:ribosomal protein S18 acetylase RimI-like enzyme
MGLAAVSAQIEFRPATAADRDFLLRVYASTRTEELAPVPWSPAQKGEFLRMQFEAQDRDYRSKYPPEDFQVILAGSTPIGRLYLHHADDELNLIDIAFLPEHCGRGLGTALLRELMAQAQYTRRPIRLYVEHFNPARRLYQRLGFTDLEEHGPYWRMEWAPAAAAP